MPDYLRFPLASGGSMLVQAGSTDSMTRVGRGDKIIAEVTQTLEEALAPIRTAAESAIRSFQGLTADQVEVAFGVNLSAEIGAFVAKTGGEAHLQVTLKWAPPAVS